MFYLGVDLGQRVDHTALALVEKLQRFRPYGPAEFDGVAVRHVERIPLGMPYPMVVKYIRQVLQEPEVKGRCGLVVDATGVGSPVVEMLRGAGLGCEISAVTITGGEKETQWMQFGWNVPKRDLISGVQMLLQGDQLKIAKDLPEVESLVKDLMDVRATGRASGRLRVGADGSGEHDDLVIALALGCWKASRKAPKIGFGTQRLF